MEENTETDNICNSDDILNENEINCDNDISPVRNECYSNEMCSNGEKNICYENNDVGENEDSRNGINSEECKIHGNGHTKSTLESELGDNHPKVNRDLSENGNGCVLQMEEEANIRYHRNEFQKTDTMDSIKVLPTVAEESENEGPEYLPQFRSRRGAEVGSENLITNDISRFSSVQSCQVIYRWKRLSKTFPTICHMTGLEKNGVRYFKSRIRDLRLAATLVADAIQGHSFEIKREPRFVRSYNLFKSMRLRVPLYFAIFISMALALFEEPALPELAVPYWATMLIEVFCLAFFIFRVLHHWHWRMPRGFKRDIKNVTAIACIVITVCDMIAYIVTKNWFDIHSVRYSRALRALLIMTFSDGTHLRRAWSNIRMTLKQISHVIALFYFLIIVFSLVSMKMFQHRDDMRFPDNSAYFKNYLECFWQLYVLVTTANNPDVMLPAYNKSRWYSVFFTLYIILCLYLMLNILLAVTYNSYRENMKNQIKHSALKKTKTLHQAFEVIKINVEGKEMVTYKTWLRLIKLAHPGKTKHQIDLLMMVLDTDKTGYISRQQFLCVADLLNVPVSEVSERKTLLERKCSALYLSRCSKVLHKIVQSIYFSLFYDVIVIINVILICIDLSVVEWYFFGLYVLEILLKWYTVGAKRYFYNFQNCSDVFITMMSLVVLIVTETNLNEGDSDTLSVLNVFRIFRLLRMLIEFERFKIIFDAVFNVSFSIVTYCAILFIAFYSFAIIGMEVFGGRFHFIGYNLTDPNENELSCNNSALVKSAFAANRYCNINFNDIINAFVVLASLLIVNNWHIICEGFVLVTNKGARIYFMMFHLCVAVVVMNIVTAFILDMFLHEYTFSKKGTINTKVETTIKNLQLGMDDETGRDLDDNEAGSGSESKQGRHIGKDGTHKNKFRRLTMRTKTHMAKPNLTRYDGIRFHIKKRGWTKTELLLQQLFELEDEQEKHANNDDIRMNT